MDQKARTEKVAGKKTKAKVLMATTEMTSHVQMEHW